ALPLLSNVTVTKSKLRKFAGAFGGMDLFGPPWPGTRAAQSPSDKIARPITNAGKILWFFIACTLRPGERSLGRTNAAYACHASSSPINFRVHRVPLGRLLERQSDAQRRGFVIQSTREHDRSWEARRARETAR